MKDHVTNTGELGSKENNVAPLDNLFTLTNSGNNDAISVDEVNYPTFINFENKDSSFIDNNINNAYEFLLTSVDEKVLCDNVDEENVNLDKEIYSPDRVNYFNDMEDTERMII